MQNYLLMNLSELAQKRAVLMREEAQLWDILARDLTREARRLDEATDRRRSRAPVSALPVPAQTPEERKILVGIQEAAQMMGIGRSKLYNEIGASRLKVRKSGKRTLMAIDDIEDWCANLLEHHPG